jgi:hypothetical protein
LKRSFFGVIFLFYLISACQDKTASNADFRSLTAQETGIAFANTLDYNEELNAYTYRNFYNGAGVAIGDINNDGLEDIYIAGNQVDNKLYLNLGDLRFKDITTEAGVASPNVWSSGVSMADVNGDGWLDIYVCKSGPLEGSNRNNELFINNGDGTFSEQAAQWGIADKGLSNHAAFFDYDKDGDLDMYLLNNSTRSVGIYDLRKGQREIRDPDGGNKLYKNDGDRYTDVSEEASIFGSAIGYGLGVTFADVNADNWPDIFVSNDFFERDYLYLNQQDGTFKEVLESTIKETSMGSMGADIADLDGDGKPEIFVTEMLPRDPQRVKTKTIFENWDKHYANAEAGYHHQFTRNTLQWNQGNDNNGLPLFSEVSRISGVDATDWSWGALIFDYNNDGLDDLFVANGIYKDLTDQDYINFYANNTLQFEEYKKDSVVITKLIDVIPSVPLRNFLFQNEGSFQFSNVAETAGLDEKVFSNGAAYADLDQDGDLDIVVNNINSEFLLYENLTSQQSKHHFLKFNFGDEGYQYFGTKVTVSRKSKSQTKEFTPVKGYMSSMTHELHFGLAADSTDVSVAIEWPDGAQSFVENIAVDQNIDIRSLKMISKPKETNTSSTLFNQMEQPQVEHRENTYSDFDRDRLILQMSSNEGPASAVGDINGDGLEDLFIGGSKGISAQLIVQKLGELISSPFPFDQLSEDTDAELIDIDSDGDLDLLVASGGHEFSYQNPQLQDRLYLNDGDGNFTKSEDFNPVYEPSSFITSTDYDLDGDLDIICGTRQIPFAYGVPAGLHLYENQEGQFKQKPVDAFEELGMITSGQAVDLDLDGDDDLVVGGEWMPITIFINDNGLYRNATQAYGLNDTKGLWRHLNIADINGDGKPDILAGNQGLNTRLKASRDQPLKMYVNDFDQNRSVEQIFTQYEGDEEYPIVMLPDLIKQLPALKKKYVKHEAYKDQRIQDIFEETVLANSIVGEAQILSSAVFIQAEGRFEFQALPFAAQISQIYASHIQDLNKDGIQDIMIAGNQKRVKPELGSNNASYGLVLLGNTDGTFDPLAIEASGLIVPEETRSIKKIIVGEKVVFLFIRNNEKSLAFELN